MDSSISRYEPFVCNFISILLLTTHYNIWKDSLLALWEPRSLRAIRVIVITLVTGVILALCGFALSVLVFICNFRKSASNICLAHVSVPSFANAGYYLEPWTPRGFLYFAHTACQLACLCHLFTVLVQTV
jgi:hypothetical protein